jgi:hypothetical protein
VAAEAVRRPQQGENSMSTSGYVQADLPKMGPENKPQPAVSESFTVIVESPDCKCSVVATGDLHAGVRRVFAHERCRKNTLTESHAHKQKMHELAQLAQSQMLLLIADVKDAREPV